MFRGYCQKDQRVLFDVPSFEAFKKKPPNLAVKVDPRVFLTCRHCGLVYKIFQDKMGDIVYKLKGSSKNKPPIKAEKYG